MSIGQSAGKSFAYLLGVYLGDGCVTTNNNYPVFSMSVIDSDFIDEVEKSYLAISDAKYNRYFYQRELPKHGLHMFVGWDQELCSRFPVDTEQKTKIPAYVWQMPRDEQESFVVGLMDSEGWVGVDKPRKGQSRTRWSMGFSSTDVWASDFVRLLGSLGIVATGPIWYPHSQAGRKPYWTTRIKMTSWAASGLRFNIGRKNDRVDDWAKANLRDSTSDAKAKI